jgi:hypothetical protein
MADVKVVFVHPTDGRRLTVTLDGSMTVAEVVGELIANDFVPPDQQGYDLGIKGGRQLRAEESLADAGVKDGTTLNVIPATDAGIEIFG